jgi:hypothetical protein
MPMHDDSCLVSMSFGIAAGDAMAASGRARVAIRTLSFMLLLLLLLLTKSSLDELLNDRSGQSSTWISGCLYTESMIVSILAGLVSWPSLRVYNLRSYYLAEPLNATARNDSLTRHLVVVIIVVIIWSR